MQQSIKQAPVATPAEAVAFGHYSKSDNSLGLRVKAFAVDSSLEERQAKIEELEEGGNRTNCTCSYSC